MTNVRRPVHLQLRPTSIQPTSSRPRFACASSKSPLSQSADLLPSQILPHLFVGDQAQTNSETLDRLNIGYILSLGLLPLVSASGQTPSNIPSPAGTDASSNVVNISPVRNKSNNVSLSNPQTPSHPNQNLLPSRDSSRDFKIRIRASTGNQPVSPSGINSEDARKTSRKSAGHSSSNSPFLSNQQNSSLGENKNAKTVRSIHCKCINVADKSEQGLAKFFDEAHQFIDEARRKKCNILVHCLAGVSRSPTFAIAYLMRVNSLSLQDAFNLVKRCRPQIDPNLSFISQLMVYEESLDDRLRRQRLHQHRFINSFKEGRESPSTGNSIHINPNTNESNNKL